MLKAVHIIMGVAILVVGFMGIASVIYLWGASTSLDWAHVSGWLPHGERTKSCCSIVFFNKNIFFFTLSLYNHTLDMHNLINS